MVLYSSVIAWLLSSTSSIQNNVRTGPRYGAPRMAWKCQQFPKPACRLPCPGFKSSRNYSSQLTPRAASVYLSASHHCSNTSGTLRGNPFLIFNFPSPMSSTETPSTTFSGTDLWRPTSMFVLHAERIVALETLLVKRPKTTGCRVRAFTARGPGGTCTRLVGRGEEQRV